MKRVIIVHRWHGSPKADWYPWLKSELQKIGFVVEVPKMPNPSEPKIDEWVERLLKIPDVDKNTYFVGHSVGCQAILRYLEKSDKRIGGAMFVAGWFTLTNLEPEEKPIARAWLETPINFGAAKRMTAKFTAIFSDNDPYVPLKRNKEMFEKKLDAKIIIDNGKGHFTDEEGVTKAQSILESILKISGK